MTGDHDQTLRAFEQATAAAAHVTYVMTLFVTGASGRSARAIANARELCDTYLVGRHRLAIVDLLDDLDAVRGDGVLAAPTLVLHEPLPSRRFVGDLSQPRRVLDTLGIPHAAPPHRGA